MRIGKNERVLVNMLRGPDSLRLVPACAIVGYGYVINNDLSGDYPYEVALEAQGCGRSGIANRYIYREEEVSRASEE